MNKSILNLTMIVLLLLLAACGGASASSDENTENQKAGSTNVENEAPGETAEGNRSDENTLSAEMELMLGTVKLDETEDAVESEQASELLPLWKALRSLSQSETAATQEVEALINQIEDTMTTEQMDAIRAMELSFQSIAEVGEVLGVEMGFGGGRFGEMTPEMQATMEAMRESGESPQGGGGAGRQFPGGDFPGGQPPGGGQISGGGFSPEQQETAIARRVGTRGTGFGINTGLLDAIIEFLEAKV